MLVCFRVDMWSPAGNNAWALNNFSGAPLILTVLGSPPPPASLHPKHSKSMSGSSPCLRSEVLSPQEIPPSRGPRACNVTCDDSCASGLKWLETGKPNTDGVAGLKHMAEARR